MVNKVELYVIRHGLAAERGDHYPDDAVRPLTQQGIDRLKQEADGLIELGVDFDLILTSPLARARQTADILAAALPSRPAVVSTTALAPGAGRSAVVDALAGHAGERRIALVGHEPDLGELAARLIGARAAIEFKKGAICRIDVPAIPPAGPGRLRWFLTPRILRKVGR